MSKRTSRSFYRRYMRVTVVVLIVSFLAVAFIRAGGAETFTVSAEAEAGTVSGPAAVSPSSTASGGSAVLFKAGASTAPCSVSGDPPLKDQLESAPPRYSWPHTKPKKAVIYYITNALPATWANYVVFGAKAWSDSNCIDARTASSCPSSSAHCIPVKLDTVTTNSSGIGNTQVSYSGNDLTSANIVLYEKKLGGMPASMQQSTTTHEMGHSLGLKHRATRYKVLYSTNEEQRANVPDSIDFDNLLSIYGGSSVSSQVTGQNPASGTFSID